MNTSDADPTDSIHIVYAEDDDRLAKLTMEFFAGCNIVTTLVTCGDAVMSEVMRIKPDVVVLDIMLPRLSGLEACAHIRQRFDVPIIMVTARVGEAERVAGLDGGADDYVTKPFSALELVARIRAHSRRARGRVGPRRERMEIGDVVIDASKMSVSVHGADVMLTTSEFELLRVLAERAGRVVGRDQLLGLMRGATDYAFDRSIDVLVSRLRHKLGDDPRRPKLLKTVRNLGYMLSTIQ